jgi:hypothetical protein
LFSYLPWLVKSSICANTLLVKEALITKLGRPAAPQIGEPAFGHHNQPLPVGKHNLVDLRLDFFPG